jgi:DNA (cytosine-5)-methyltransferase 1
MRYLSVCSGIEAVSVAWHDLGWTPVGFSEIDKFPSEVLAKRFPDVQNFGDMTKYKEWTLGRDTVDILVGGTPCQSFSVAGLRKGLDDPRGNLALTFVSMVEFYQPEFFIWENVPGVLSSEQGRDFGSLLTAVGYIGYGWAYRVLDAQYFGVPQRRRRVFLVGHISGDSRRAAEILFESESFRGNPPKSRKPRETTPTDVKRSTDIKVESGPLIFNPSNVRLGNDLTFSDKTGALLATMEKNGDNQQCVLYTHHPSDGRLTEEPDTSGTLTAHMGTGGGNTPLVQHIFRKSTRPRCKDGEETWVDDGVANTLNCFDIGDIQSTNLAVQPIALAENTIGRQPMNGGNGNGFTVGGPMYTLNATGVHGVAHSQTFKVRGGGNSDGSRGGKVGGSGGTGYLGQNEKAFTISVTQDQYVAHDIANTLRANPGSGFRSDGTPVDSLVYVSKPSSDVGAFKLGQSECARSIGYSETLSPTLTSTSGGNSVPAVHTKMIVRRLMPIECERLQGFPDNWTDVRDSTPDGPRYKSIGNSMAVPVMAWLGKRIQESKDKHG